MTMTTTPEDQPDEKKIDKFLAIAARINTLKDNGQELIYCMEEDKFYLYEKGVFTHLFDIQLMALMVRLWPRINKFPLSQRKQIIENIKYLKYKRLADFNWCELMNMKNGMISPFNGEFYEHEPMYYSTIQLPYNYTPEAECGLWVKTLLEIFEENLEMLEILQEFFGYCLTRQTKYEKALLLLGEARSGKSTILTVLRAMLGVTNCSSVPLKHIANAQFTPMLVNKLVNIDSDVSGNANDYEAEFKTITSGEPVSCNQKFVATFEFNPYCKLVMAANTFPKISDHSSAFYKRLVLLPCDRVFEPHEQNINLKHELMAELPGILNWAIKGLQRLEKRGRFIDADFMKDAVKELRDINNPSDIFLEEHTAIDRDCEIEKAELYEKYKIWCAQTSNFPLSPVKFSQCVFRKYAKVSPKKCQNKYKKYIWKNIKYVDHNQPIGDKGWLD